MSDPWTPDPRTFTSWSVETTGSTQRITEQGSVRITEQGNIRIIETMPFSWSIESNPINPWTQE